MRKEKKTGDLSAGWSVWTLGCWDDDTSTHAYTLTDPAIQLKSNLVGISSNRFHRNRRARTLLVKIRVNASLPALPAPLPATQDPAPEFTRLAYDANATSVLFINSIFSPIPLLSFHFLSTSTLATKLLTFSSLHAKHHSRFGSRPSDCSLSHLLDYFNTTVLTSSVLPHHNTSPHLVILKPYEENGCL